MQKTPLIIDYFSDVLCIWAWIAQRRITELEVHWGDKIAFRYHYLNLFGDTAARMEQHWVDRGGYEGFGRHVLAVAEPYEAAPVNSMVWHQVRPLTSANSHLVLKAAELIGGVNESAKLAAALRKAFFVDATDIGKIAAVMGIAGDCGFCCNQLTELIDGGQAMAGLMTDYKKAEDQGVKGSPTWVMNAGRQVLYGNVGYRVLSANIEEILKKPQQEASWC